MYLVSFSRFLACKTSFKLMSCAALVGLADFLFYGKPIGATFGFFGLLLLLAMRSHAGAGNNVRLSMVASAAVLGLGLAVINQPSTLAVCLFIASMLALALLPQLARLEDIRPWLRAILGYLLLSWGRLFEDGLMISHVGRRRQKRTGRRRSFLRHWLLPLGMSGVFIALFAQANPIVTGWLDAIRWAIVIEYVAPVRVLFWGCMACLCWALIRPKYRQRVRAVPQGGETKQRLTLTALLFNERSILTSLVLFNGLFLIQNLLDVAFLWSGAALPAGMSYAQYAHQGAYPLILTALLAALFVLIALKPGSSTEGMRMIRLLVYGWVGQNIFLVISSILRLVGYIEEYSLTYLRVAALLWMVLVVLGLALIVARIRLGRSNRWLVNSNAAMLYATLYICCFVNFGHYIAYHNVQHATDANGTMDRLDLYYLTNEIGVASLPALEWLVQHHPKDPRIGEFRQQRAVLDMRLQASMDDWHQWTLRDYRLWRASAR